ncbi:glycoside hydrolase family 2 protein [Clostridium cellulovorans]|uniref:Beta-glucuronidase n=2 Tax=Clostridium cellulovorans TaxID=1493 RepID=D9SRV2_CLOC7|nr:glycoside hydrolase family 2 TIM barrel-domain containing protein [Clostridium cellulovorans]ADL50469.1 Beta-glucuronidase [Clostridium cellulovorans 743B]
MNTRLFQNHIVRKEIHLNPVWDFHTLNSEDKKQEAFKMLVPGCWESTPKLASYKGKAMYSKKVTFGGNIRLVFKGVSHTAYVYLDNKQVGYHYNAYTEFSVLLQDIPYGEHLLEIKVDNSFHQESALHVTNDYYSYGGITRPMVIEEIDEMFIKYVHFIPYRENNKWYASISASISNLSNEQKNVTLQIRIGDEVVSFANKALLPNAETLFENTFEFSSAIIYTLENPKLYMMNAMLLYNDEVVDDLIDRVGFRDIKVNGKDILFSGKKVIIKGVNRHEDYAEFGCAIPIEAMYRDIEIIKSLGANCIRTCHYPNDERFLDLCDENGILVWEEAHARGLNEEQMKHKNFEKQSSDCIKEMIENHINHPSIYVWGILNECVSNTEFGRSCYAKQFKLIKSLDSSRPVTFASLEAHIGSDLCLDLVDIVSFNIYPGWYHNTPLKDSLNALKNFVNSKEGAGKPLLISEIGAGAIYGFRSNNMEKWTEEYQQYILTEQLTSILSDEELSGVIIWQYADCRVDNGWFHGRPKCQNNKGIVDIYRREKLSFNKVKEIFHSYLK